MDNGLQSPDVYALRLEGRSVEHALDVGNDPSALQFGNEVAGRACLEFRMADRSDDCSGFR